jgi:hypothetical protein
MPSAWLELDADLRERLRDVLAEPRRPITEAELRKLADEGRACRLLLAAELKRLERRLGKADGDPHSSLGEIAEAYRRVHDFRVHVEELDGLMAALDDRAREVRSSWRQRMTDRSR